MSVDPFKRLVKLAARAFYEDITTERANQSNKMARNDNRGIAVVVLDALTNGTWIREEALSKQLRIHMKHLRWTLRFLEEEKLVARDYKKEAAKNSKWHKYGQQNQNAGDNKKIKMRTYSYCCLDYAQIYDVVRYRLHRMRKMLKGELENKDTVQHYVCPYCTRRYSALDALRLISLVDEYFHCENCDGELVAETDKLAAQQGGGDGDGGDNTWKRRREKLKDMFEKMEVQLKPLMDQLNRVKYLTVAEFGSLQAAIGNSEGHDGEMKVEVAFYGVEDREDIKSETSNTGLKVLPPWMIKQGMNLTKEQCGEVDQEAKMDDSSTAAKFSDEKSAKEIDTSIQEEYAKAYYAALLKKQEEAEASAKKLQELSQSSVSNGLSESYSTRQVGKKSKREDEGDDDVEWLESSIQGISSESDKVNDLNPEAPSSGEDDDDDDIDWEEG